MNRAYGHLLGNWGVGVMYRPVYGLDGRKIEPTDANVRKYTSVCESARRAYARAMMPGSGVSAAKKADLLEHMTQVCSILDNLKQAAAAQARLAERQSEPSTAEGPPLSAPPEALVEADSGGMSPLVLFALLAMALGGGVFVWRRWRKKKKAA